MYFYEHLYVCYASCLQNSYKASLTSQPFQLFGISSTFREPKYILTNPYNSFLKHTSRNSNSNLKSSKPTLSRKIFASLNNFGKYYSTTILTAKTFDKEGRSSLSTKTNPGFNLHTMSHWRVKGRRCFIHRNR